MKAFVTLAAGLILVSTTFAQSSRRSEVKENNQTNDRRSETTVRTERRVPSEKRTEINDPRRNAATQPVEKKAEYTDQQSSQRRSEGSEATMNSERRSTMSSPENNSRNSENQRTERMAVEKPQTPPSNSGQDRSSVTNRRNPSEQKPNNYNNGNNRPSYSTNNYNNDRRENHETVVIEHSRRTVEPRHHTVVHKSYRPVPVEVRRVKYPYRSPGYPDIIWTVELSRRFEVYYPAYRPYNYHIGMRIATISAYDAFDYVGEIARVYGRVAETYYSPETDEYFLYIGDYYPYQDFSVIIPGREARDFSRRPERFFNREYIEVTGLITRFEGKPEMVIKRSSQINVY